MTDELGGVLLTILAYFAGSFPTASVVGMLSGHDHSKEGSGNPGASNVYRTSGAVYGIVTVLVDAMKGFLPVLVTLLLIDRPWAAVVWAAATVGHVFPIARWLRGGKGVATSGGGALPLFPAVGAALFVLFIIVVKFTRRASAGSLVIAIGLPLGVFFFYEHIVELLASIAVSAIVLLRHWRNIGRLISGDELKVR